MEGEGVIKQKRIDGCEVERIAGPDQAAFGSYSNRAALGSLETRRQP